MFEDIIYIDSDNIEDKVLRSCSSILAAFLPGKTVRFNALVENNSFADILKIKLDPKLTSIHLYYYEKNRLLFYREYDLLPLAYKKEFILPGKETLHQIQVKRAMYLFLQDLTGKSVPWGILTGVRPGKLIFRMQELGISKATQKKTLADLYMVADEKIKLLWDIAENQKNSLKETYQNKNNIALYISIPFCPSRCFYCSFPSRSIGSPNNENLFFIYLKALKREIELTGSLMKKYNLQADKIYIGGGTPTVLNNEQLTNLLEVIRRNISMLPGLEYTMEAGRPDTLDESKMKIMVGYGINRISINPQTMQDNTLKTIGRTHTVADIVAKYYEARKVATWTINMDLILGLPGEGLDEVKQSIEKILQLKPDNITVHALSLKKGSKAWEQHYTHAHEIDWLNVQRYVEQQLTSEGFKPYYLYRQKYIAGNLENVGYSLPGKECCYNIVMIEEKQIILGLGAGATSKIFLGEKQHENKQHENIYSSNDIGFYIDNFEKFNLKKEKMLANLYYLDK